VKETKQKKKIRKFLERRNKYTHLKEKRKVWISVNKSEKKSKIEKKPIIQKENQKKPNKISECLPKTAKKLEFSF
jgi:hypothetical protein